MRQLTFIEPHILEWREVPAPRLAQATDAVVRPLAVARCDLDFYIATGVVNYPGPFAFGHEMVAEVVEAGDGAGVEPGQRVVVPFQLSCGRCGACRRGWTNSCEAFPFGAAFGLQPTSGVDYGGALSDLIHVPYADHMLVPLPTGLDPVTAASLSDNIADGWRAVGPQLADRPGATVLVVGGLAQSVGLYAAAAAVGLGAGQVLYLDDDPGRRACAIAIGAQAEPLALAEGRGPERQFDIVVEAAGDAAGLGFAIQSCAANGELTSVAIHFGETTALPLARAYYKGLTYRTGRVHSRAALPHALSCVACGRWRPELITHRIATFEEAPMVMADPGPKVVFRGPAAG